MGMTRVLLTVCVRGPLRRAALHLVQTVVSDSMAALPTPRLRIPARAVLYLHVAFPVHAG